MTRCPSCGASNPNGAGFCGECGRQLPAGQVCPDCGYARNPSSADYCIQCGASLRGRSFSRFLWIGAALTALVAASILWQTGLFQEWVGSVTIPAPGRLPIFGATSTVDEQLLEQQTPHKATPTLEKIATVTATATATSTTRTEPPKPTSTSTTVPKTPTAVATPTQVSPSSCPGAPPQRVQVNERAWVCTAYEQLIVRQRPGLRSREISRLEPGTYLTVIDGPQCADSWSWWRIRTDDGLSGWVSEGGDDIDPYFICPTE